MCIRDSIAVLIVLVVANHYRRTVCVLFAPVVGCPPSADIEHFASFDVIH